MNGRQPQPEAAQRGRLLLAALAWWAFIVYGSLVPLEFNPFAFDIAWKKFLSLRYVELGIESRADWVANILLYIPLAFLLSAGLAPRRGSAAGNLLRDALVLAACAVTAVCVEFAQMFFPPRSVLANDLLAELLGTLAGIAIWRVWGGRLLRIWAELRSPGPLAIRAAFTFYLIAYVALSLFPYDFLISAREIAGKSGSNAYGLLAAEAACNSVLLCTIKLAAEVAAAAPLGILLGIAFGERNVYRKAAWSGLALGLSIEVTQFFLASGVSQGLSVATRTLGLLLGAAVHGHASRKLLVTLQPWFRTAVALAALPYLAALMWANGWISAGWAGIDHALANLEQLRWLPFYYHYYTTETSAVRSLLAHVAMYLPVGIACWMWRYGGRDTIRGSAFAPAALAGLLAAAMETGKLFVPGKRPDPTDLLIAAAAAGAAYQLAVLLLRWSSQPAGVPAAAPARAPRPAQAAPVAPLGRRVAAIALLAVCAAGLVAYPLGGHWLLLALTAYAALLWRHPTLWPAAVAAALPLLNFAPRSGWLYLEELDFLLAVTLAACLLRHPTDARARAPGTRALAGLLLASFSVSALVGLLPLAPLDQNAFASYFSGYNGLRVLKGFLWALVLLPLLARELDSPEAELRFAGGMTAGVAAVGTAALWERMVFPGLLDFSSDYRIGATFPEVHTGGAYIEAWLAAAIPFAVFWTISARGWLRAAAGVATFALGSHAMAVTFARAGYLGYAGALAVLGAGVLIHLGRQRGWSLRRAIAGGLLLAAGAAVSVPIIGGSYMQSRLASAGADASARARHWSAALDLMRTDWGSALFGMGLGSFPRTYLAGNLGGASPATFGYLRENGNTYLRLGSGESLYLGQRVGIEPGATYLLTLDLGSSSDQPELNVMVCEKSLLYSFRCTTLEFALKGGDDSWHHRELAFESGELGIGPPGLRRPVVLALVNPRAATLIDVDNVRLVDAAGRDLIANGDFSRGGERWFFTTDDQLPFHIEQLWLQVLFEQGWLGVLALAAGVLASLLRLAQRVRGGELFAATLLASLAGLLLVGLYASVIDVARLALLFYLLLFLALAGPGRASSTRRAAGPSAA